MGELASFAVFGILIVHFVFDFILQSHKMATNKSKSNKWLTKHVAVYTGGLFVSYVWFLVSGFILTYPMFIGWVLLNGVLHWITDYFTSRKTSKYFGEGDYHNGFVVVGFDQLIHYACLIGTAELFLRF